MGGSYRQCTECGKRALSIATRCPACGRELLAPPVHEGRNPVALHGLPLPLVVGGALAVLAGIAIATRGPGSPLAKSHTLSSADAITTTSEVAFATAGLDTARTATPRDQSASVLLITRTWTRVRKSRSVSGDLEAVLLPGDTVLADSLRHGWYRVALEGEVLGYAHRSTLTAPGGETGHRTAVEAGPAH